jgi:hypothetical protein
MAVPPPAQRGRLLLISDIVPPYISAAAGAAALLRFGRDNGFLCGAVIVSPYWRPRSRYGLTRYSQAAITDKLAAAGFTAQLASTARPASGTRHLRTDARP